MINAPNAQHLRYAKVDFPPYRFVPGETAHPTENPNGHSYGKKDEDPGILDEKTWFENGTYLLGVDLYNFAYWWEAHEAFEGLWKKYSNEDVRSQYLQGLIKISGAFLKWHLKQHRGVEVLFHDGMNHLYRVCDKKTTYMGLNLMDYLAKLTHHFRAVVTEKEVWPDPTADYPFIVLEKYESKANSPLSA